MPAGVTAAALAAAAGATGAVTNLETHQIFDRDEQAAIRQARRHRPRGLPAANCLIAGQTVGANDADLTGAAYLALDVVPARPNVKPSVVTIVTS